MHFADTMSAAGPSGPEVDWQRTFTSMTAQPNPISSSAQISVYGQGSALDGSWRGLLNGALLYDLDWTTPNSLSTAAYYTRIINASNNNPPSVPEPLRSHVTGDWSQKQTAWRNLQSVSPGGNMGYASAHTYAVFSNYTSADRELIGTLQLGRLSTTPVTFEQAQVNTGTDTIEVSGHGLVAGDAVRYIAGGAAPTPLVSGSFYWVVTNGAGAGVRLASSHTNASNNTYLNITFSGTGTGHQLIPIESQDSMAVNLFADGYA